MTDYTLTLNQQNTHCQFADEDVVIAGVGGRFPEADNLSELMDNLFSGVNMVNTANPRWHPGALGVPIAVGKMKSLTKFDAQYFGIARKQCHALDPITRQVLERAYEAILDAGLHPSQLRGSNACVFFGSTISETETLLVHSKATDGYHIMGRNRALNANRLSYWLDLKGSSFAFDSTWCSGLRGVELAVNEIRTGRCDTALVATGGTVVHANASKQFQDLNFLSQDGITRSFDEHSSGYGRSEAVCVLLLQKATLAKRSYGTIVHVSTRTVEESENKRLIAPAQEDWSRFLREFYQQCKVDPGEVGVLEADGAACKEYDTAELNAVGEVMCGKRTASNPLLIGSVKSNLGHAEASATMCSLAKVVIAMHTGKIPGNLNYTTPNTRVHDLVTGKMKVVTEATDLPGQLVAINSFGLGGSYGHLLMRRPTASSQLSNSLSHIPRLVLTSGKSEEAMESVLDQLEAMPLNDEYLHLVNGVFSRPVTRHMFRAYTTVPPLEPRVRDNQKFSGEKRPLWFVFAGMGSQWPGMAKNLMDHPIFRRSIDQCHDILVQKGLDLRHIVTTDDPAIFDNILHCFVGIGAVQVALVDVLRAMGIVPDGIIGHSVGEMGAAYADGCFDKEQMMLSAYSRGKVSLETPVVKGMMAAVGLGYDQIKDQLPPDIEVACHNGPDSCTLSGPAESVQEYVAQLKSSGVFAKAVNVANIAYHSRYVADMGPKLLQYLTPLIPKPKERSVKWVSSSVLEAHWNLPAARFCSAEYLTNNLLGSVLFEEGSRHIPANAITIEIAPHGLLQAILKRSLDKGCINIPLTNKTVGNQLHFLLKSVGRMYVAGLNPNVNALYPEIQYPVSCGTPFLSSLATWDHSDTWSTISYALTSKGTCSKEFHIRLGQSETDVYSSYKFAGKTMVAPAMYLMLVWEMYASYKSKTPSQMNLVFQKLSFRKPVFIEKERILHLFAMVQVGSGKFEVTDEESILVSGVLREEDSAEGETRGWAGSCAEHPVVMSQADFYAELEQAGHQFQNPLLQVTQLVTSESVWKANIQWTGNLAVLLDSILQVRLVKASEAGVLMYQLSAVHEVWVDPTCLPEPGSDITVLVDVAADTVSGPGIYLSHFRFNSEPRKAIEFTDRDLSTSPPCVPADGALLDKAFNISYIEPSASNIESGQLGFAGVNAHGRKVMGVGLADEVSLRMRPDAILSWDVPDVWSLEEAATVPISYSLAYYTVVQLGSIRPGQRVVVTNGLSCFGQAAIRVSLDRGADVLTSVRTRSEVQKVLSLFPKVKVEHVLVLTDTLDGDLGGLELLLHPDGQGAHLILNTDSGKLLPALLDCTTGFSKVIHFSSDLEPHDELYGTVNFSKDCSLYVVYGNSLVSCEEKVKEELKGLLAEGMRSGVVEPLPRCLVSQQQLQQREPRGRRSHRLTRAIELVKLDVAPSHNLKKRFVCEANKTYVIVGGDDSAWLYVTEWLVQRQAKHIIVMHGQKEVSAVVCSKIDRMQGETSIDLHCVSGYDLSILGKLVNPDTRVAAAIILPLETNPEGDLCVEAIRALDARTAAQDEKCYLLCVLRSASKGVKLCSERSQQGLPTLAVLWDGHMNGKTKGFLQALDTLLVPNGRTAIQVVDEEAHLSEKSCDSERALKLWLPQGLDEVISYSKSLPRKVQLTELRTFSPALEHVRETVPMFLLPGINFSQDLMERFQTSFYPVIVLQLPHLGNCSVQEYAACLLPKVKSSTAGPYILVGENWSGAVAMEVARQLEAMGDRVQVVLLSATPHEVLEPLRSLGTDDGNFSLNLLSRVFGIDDVQLLQEISNQTTWRERLNLAVSSCVAEEEQEVVISGVDSIKCRLEGLIAYHQERKAPLNCAMTIVTNADIPSHYIYRLCKEDVTVHDVEGQDQVLTLEVFRMIHELAISKRLER